MEAYEEFGRPGVQPNNATKGPGSQPEGRRTGMQVFLSVGFGGIQWDSEGCGDFGSFWAWLPHVF